MAVSTLELRPRGAVALLDAVLRLCARSTGVWALTLPGGVLVSAALLHLAEGVSQRQEPALPALWLTLAWLARGLLQGAACHHVQELLLGQGEPGVLASVRAAAARAPSLLITVAYLFTFQAVTLPLSLGLAAVLLPAQVVGYAATLQGRGSPLRLYETCVRLLGPARRQATGVRILLWLLQALVFFNLHAAVSTLLFIGRKLLALELTFAERFASLDNGPWLLCLAALTFILSEPLRAAAATLLLVDGRVRQEGLDLLAAVQQLPGGTSRRPGAQGAGRVLLALAVLLPPAAARAEPSRDGLAERLERLAAVCELDAGAPRRWQEKLAPLGPAEALKFQRLLRGVEDRVYGDEDCGALERLEQGVALAAEAAALEQARQDARATAARARDILARPEFSVAPPEPEAPREAASPEPPGFWQRLLDWLARTLDGWFGREEPSHPHRSFPGLSGQGLAHALVVLIVGAVLGVLAAVLLRALRRQRHAEGGSLEVSTRDLAPLAADPLNALSRLPEGWAHLADTLAARGEYREAVRNLYLALLSHLHREGAILYDATLSNWDYLHQFKGPREWRAPFRELTRRFDFAWYGNLPVGPAGYDEFRALCAPLLSPAGTPGAAGA